MKLTGKIEVFKSKKGYLLGIIKAFSQDNKMIAKEFVDVQVKDEKLAKKVVEGKTITFDVSEGYLNLRHVELETESFNRLVISISKAKVVDIFPKDKTSKK